MAMSDDGVGLVLLDQWHVDVLVPASMDDSAAETVRNRIDASLREWAVGASVGLAGVLVQVEQ